MATFRGEDDAIVVRTMRDGMDMEWYVRLCCGKGNIVSVAFPDVVQMDRVMPFPVTQVDEGLISLPHQTS